MRDENEMCLYCGQICGHSATCNRPRTTGPAQGWKFQVPVTTHKQAHFNANGFLVIDLSDHVRARRELAELLARKMK